jgi:choline monooxygenase
MSKKLKYKINSDISKARTLASSYYTDENIFRDSIEKIFSSSWQFALNIDQLNDDNIIPITFLKGTLSEPLLLIKDKNKLKCISNVCTHRGHIICNKPKKGNSLTCRYHGRTFDLNGKVKKAIGFKGAKDFPSKEDNLQDLQTKEWKNFIFISLSSKAKNLSVLDDINNRLKNFPFDKIKYSKKLSNCFNINTHWAMYCENYLEGFHVPFVHKGLSKEINNQSYQTQILKNGVLQYANNSDVKDRGLYAYYYWIFPNMMFNFYDWGLSINIVEPIAMDQTRVRFLSFPINNSKASVKSISDLICVEYEDQKVVESVCKGIKSRYYDSGRYAPNHESGVHYFHQLLSKFV